MFSAVTCAEPGSGKSWLDIALAEDLDRSSYDKSRFNIDRIYFTAAEFAKGMAGKWPKGTVHVFDDAGINLFSREAMQKDVRDVAKIFQSVRYKNYIILLSLPSFGMLDKVVRKLVNAYIQPTSIDKKERVTRFKFQWLVNSPMEDTDPYKYSPVRALRYTHPLLNYTIKYNKKIRQLEYPAPSKKLSRAYEKKKEECMNEYYEKISRQIKGRETSKVKDKLGFYNTLVEEVRAHVEKYRDSDPKFFAVDPIKIEMHNPKCDRATASQIAKTINIEDYKLIRRGGHFVSLAEVVIPAK